MRFSAALVVCVGSLLELVEAEIVHSRESPAPLAEACDFVGDVALVVDVSWSERDNAAALKNDAQKILSYVAGRSGWRSGLATFIDKPIPPLGWNLASWKDYCFNIAAPLGTASNAMQGQIDELYLAGGYDFPEAQLEALLRASVSDELGWKAVSSSAQRIVVIATDSIAHQPNDAANAVEQAGMPAVAENTIDGSALTEHGDDYGCTSMEYPSLESLAEALKSAKIVPVFLVAPPTYDCNGKECMYEEMSKLADERNDTAYLDPDTALTLYYTELLKELNLPGVVVPMGSGFVGIGDAFIKAMEELGSIPEICEETTTSPPDDSAETAGSAVATTPAPTDSAPTDSETTAPAPTTTATCAGENCTLRVDMVLEKCDGEEIKEVLII